MDSDLLKGSKGVIFDFDGLLADSEPFHFKAYKEVFERYGHSLNPEEYWVEFTSKGKGIAGEIERHNLKIDVDPVDMRKQKFEIYSRLCQSGEIKLFPGAVELVERLSQKLSTAIASGSWTKDIRSILSGQNAENLFSIILGKESAPKEKPNPDIFLEAANQMKVAPESCFVIEDALKGLTASKAAGMKCVIIRNPLNLNIEFPDADLEFPNLNAFLDFVKKSI
ncbi:MAG: HAD family phosphatase [Deltaproteobacteria bacterium]|nr:HAD family phosphatase [Deltaproteobacteria bacterium]